jgi:hypothetical protein
VEFKYPSFSPPLMEGRPISDPGTPAGNFGLENMACRVVPWPSSTGYIGVRPQAVGIPRLPPMAPNISGNMPINLYTGIISGLAKR